MNKMKLGPKLIGGFLSVALIAGLIGWVGIKNIDKIDAADTHLYENITVPLGGAAGVAINFQRQRVNVSNAIRYNDQAKIEDQLKRVEDRETALEEGLAELGKTLESEAGKALLARYKEADKKYEQVASTIKKLAAANRDGEAWALYDGELYAHVQELQKVTSDLVATLEKEGKQVSDGNTAIAQKASLTMTALILAGCAAAILIGLFLTFSITRPMKAGVEMMNELAKGHLDRRLKMDRGDEIGDLARTMDAYADDMQNNVVSVLKKVAAGDVSTLVKAKDEKDEIGPALIDVHKALNGLIQESSMLTKAAAEGRLTTRGEANKFKGGYREIVEGVNSTLDGVILPITEAAQVMEKVSNKDMTARVKGEYKGDLEKFKSSINKAVENLDQSLQQVSVGAEQVASASGQIGSGSQALAQGASEQASSLEEISSSLQEMTSMTKQNTANAREAKGLSDAAKKGADKGVDNMKNLSAAVDKIKKSSDDTAKIVKTIDEIAFQTNLLALNAAVEAARAGDAGKGFAVVAEEVRNLAMRSAEAAKNTANMIEESVKNAENGVALNGEVMKNFEEITTQATKVSEVMAEIAAASEQQSQGIEQVNTAVQQMNQLTQQSAANSEESASAAQELSSQAQEMQAMVATFQVSGDSGARRVKTAHAEPAHAASHAPAAARKPAPAKEPQKVAVAAGAHKEPASVIPFGDGKDGLKSF